FGGQAIDGGRGILARRRVEAHFAGSEERKKELDAFAREAGEPREGIDLAGARGAVGAEGLAFALRRAEPDDAIRTNDEFADLGANPIRRVGRETHVTFGIELLRGAEEAEVSLLDDVL